MPPTPKNNEETICSELQEELFTEDGTIQVVSDEANMVEIIKNMQEYDKSVRENIRK